MWQVSNKLNHLSRFLLLWVCHFSCGKQDMCSSWIWARVQLISCVHHLYLQIILQIHHWLLGSSASKNITAQLKWSNNNCSAQNQPSQWHRITLHWRFGFELLPGWSCEIDESNSRNRYLLVRFHLKFAYIQNTNCTHSCHMAINHVSPLCHTFMKFTCVHSNVTDGSGTHGLVCGIGCVAGSGTRDVLMCNFFSGVYCVLQYLQLL